jgi:hypothetical protein
MTEMPRQLIDRRAFDQQRRIRSPERQRSRSIAFMRHRAQPALPRKHCLGPSMRPPPQPPNTDLNDTLNDIVTGCRQLSPFGRHSCSWQKGPATSCAALSRVDPGIPVRNTKLTEQQKTTLESDSSDRPWGPRDCTSPSETGCWPGIISRRSCWHPGKGVAAGTQNRWFDARAEARHHHQNRQSCDRPAAQTVWGTNAQRMTIVWSASRPATTCLR